mmetsp:Transcript_101618/g.270259  ORF Transcript_101618/g.270259 Transcript_101618/m.270259 type:complete len:208 (-) Transcript_101618:57-680(-)|eukprot:CAMPEP_0171158724 /NCGR_PEP_ID=MMETSP0790-20130122/2660_1 /TAXON_ID=2925 /ORGANISM="Alexandrium catenella, Strain OF101" /LENGTH=207 /DNA_ID=CAMNT_0011623177 /DNA_START=65 /DNA_END=688 /DNA_ORIENTATION=-
MAVASPAVAGSGHKSKRAPSAVAPMPVKEASERYVAELRGFAHNFVLHHREAFERLTPQACSGHEEQEHQWHDVFRRFRTDMEAQVHCGAEKWGLLQEPAYQGDFVEWAAGSQELEELLAALDYKHFLELALHTLTARSGDEHPGRHPAMPPAVCSIDERLAALEKERLELLRERKRLIGCGAAKPQAAGLQQTIARQRYLDDVGLD